MSAMLDDVGRICATTDIEEYAEGFIEFEFPDDFDFNNQSDYIIKDGVLIHSPTPLSDEEAQINEEIERQKQLQVATYIVVNESAPNLTDEQALSVSMLFNEWVVGKEYKKGYIVRYNGELYRIGQDHTSQEQWKPGDSGVTAL